MSKDRDNTPIHECPDVVDHVCELLGRRYRKGQIKEKLREILPNLTPEACEKVITAAKKQIRDNYKIDATQYRGYLVEELERLLRNDKTPTKYRLKTIHELVLILGLNVFVDTEDPTEYAKRVVAAIAAADASVDGTVLLSTEEDKTNAQVSQSKEESEEPQDKGSTQAS